MRLCIVGCGQVADWHWRWLKAIDDIDDVVLVDTDRSQAERLARLVGFTGRKTTICPIAAAAAAGVDLALILTPNHAHYPCAMPFVLANIPVFIEKPVALGWAHLQWLEAAARRGKWITVGFNWRFADKYRHIQARVAREGILHAYCWKNRARDASYYAGWHGKWATDGGVICQQAVHCIDAIIGLRPEAMPRRVMMQPANRRHKIECEDTALVTIDFGDWTGVVHGTTAMEREGGKAGLMVVTPHGQLTMTEQWTRQTMWGEVFRALKDDAPPPVPVSEAVKSMRIVHAAYTSAAEGGQWMDYGLPFRKLGAGASLPPATDEREHA